MYKSTATHEGESAYTLQGTANDVSSEILIYEYSRISIFS